MDFGDGCSDGGGLYRCYGGMGRGVRYIGFFVLGGLVHLLYVLVLLQIRLRSVG